VQTTIALLSGGERGDLPGLNRSNMLRAFNLTVGSAAGHYF